MTVIVAALNQIDAAAPRAAGILGGFFVLSPLMTLHAILALVTSAHVLLTYRRPASAVAYLFAAWTIPFVGSLSYFVFSAGARKRRIRTHARTSALRRDRQGSASEDSYGDLLPDERFVNVLKRAAPFPLCPDSDVTLLTKQENLLGPMLDAIRAAESEILLQTFILATGRVATRLIDALMDAVDRGVCVRFLVDPIGSRSLPSRVLGLMKEAGIEVQTFLTPNPLKGRFQVNFRNHRKILVLDERVAFVGDSNWSDDYSTTTRSERDLVDVDVRLVGPAVAHVRRVFLEDWHVATGLPAEEADFKVVHPEGVDNGRLIRVLPHGPDESTDCLWSIFAAAIHSAREEIVLATPFFVPGATMMEALRLAALGGVRVRILVPRRSDSMFASHAAKFYLEPLVRAGVEVCLHKADFLHAKFLCIDRSWSTVGSCNFDHRSFFLNYELNLEVADREFTSDLVAFFEKQVENSDRLTTDEVDGWNWSVRLRAKLAALFEPVL